MNTEQSQTTAVIDQQSTENETKMKQKNLVVIAGDNQEIKAILSKIMQDNTLKVTVILFDGKEKIMENLPALVYPVDYRTDYAINAIKEADIILFPGKLMHHIAPEILGIFNWTYNSIVTYNKNVNFILYSSTDVYGKVRNELLFVDSKLSPYGQKGKLFAKIEEMTQSLPLYQIVRIPEIVDNYFASQIHLLLHKFVEDGSFEIVTNSNFINFVYLKSIAEATSLLFNQKESNIINITDSPKLTAHEFLYYTSMLLNKNKDNLKFISNFMWRLKRKNIPEFLFYNQNLSTIEAASIGFSRIEKADEIVSNLINNLKLI